MTKNLFFMACFALAMFLTSCTQKSETIAPAITDLTSGEMAKKWNNSDVTLPDMEEALQMMQTQAPSNKTGGDLLNGGFENGSDEWAFQAFGYGINENSSNGWIFGPSDPNGSDFNIYYGGMPHVEPLAYSGLNGASAVQNGPTVHVLNQPFTVPTLNCPGETISLSYRMRWKNQQRGPSWQPSSQDIIVVLNTPAGQEFLFQTTTENSPPFSGGGDSTEAYFEPFSFDITAHAGQEVDLQFVIFAVDYFLYVDIDDVSVEVILCSPEDAIAALVTDIADLVASGALSGGHGNALTNKLTSALQKLAQGKPQVAIVKLQAIITQVGNLINAGHISAQDGQDLIDTINSVISQL